MSFISVGFCQKDMKHVLRHSSVLSEVGFRHLEIHIILLRYVVCVCVCMCDCSGWLHLNIIISYIKLFSEVDFKKAFVKRKFWHIILE